MYFKARRHFPLICVNCYFYTFLSFRQIAGWPCEGRERHEGWQKVKNQASTLRRGSFSYRLMEIGG